MSSSVSQLYKSVIEDVINSVREVFLDESLDEHVLQELKQSWENKLMQSKAVPPEGVHVEHERVLPTQFTIQTQPQTTTAGNAQTAIKSARGLQYKYTTTALQQLPGGNVVQPTLQYQCTPGDMTDASKTVTITLPQNMAGSQKPVTIALPASAFTQQGGGFVMSSPATAAASALPAGIAAGLLHPGIATINTASLITHQNSDGTTVQYQTITPEQLAKQGYTLNVSQAATQQPTSQVQQVHLANVKSVAPGGIIQLDGARDTSDEDDDDEFKDDDDGDNDDDEQNEDENDGAGEEEEPLNSGDDVSDEDPSELFDTDNVIVCQYDKITRSRNKWKFHLKDGIMNLQGKDFVFQRAAGDAEW